MIRWLGQLVALPLKVLLILVSIVPVFDRLAALSGDLGIDARPVLRPEPDLAVGPEAGPGCRPFVCRRGLRRLPRRLDRRDDRTARTGGGLRSRPGRRVAGWRQILSRPEKSRRAFTAGIVVEPTHPHPGPKPDRRNHFGPERFVDGSDPRGPDHEGPTGPEGRPVGPGLTDRRSTARRQRDPAWPIGFGGLCIPQARNPPSPSRSFGSFPPTLWGRCSTRSWLAVIFSWVTETVPGTLAQMPPGRDPGPYFVVE